MHAAGQALLVLVDGRSQKEALFQDCEGPWIPANDDDGHIIFAPSEYAWKAMMKAGDEAKQNQTIRA